MDRRRVSQSPLKRFVDGHPNPVEAPTRNSVPFRRDWSWIRVTGVWKMTGGKLDAMAGEELNVTAMFSVIAQQVLEIDREVADGNYETFELAIEALKRKMAAGASRPVTPGQPSTR